MTSSLVRPQPRRIVPKAVVDALIADADREISALERHAERVTTAAGEAEAQLAELDTDERASAWATIQLERFVTSLRAEVEVESRAIIDEAQVRARVIIEEARAAAEEERAHRAMFGFDPPEPPSGPAPEPGTPRIPPAAANPVVVNAADTPPIASAPGDAIFQEISPDPSEVSDSATFAAPDNDFWRAEPERRRRFPRANRRVVVTQGVAVALVVAAVVVRFG